MNLLTIVLGVAALGYGCFTAYMRKKDPTKFWKLEPMKKFWGERAGFIVHFVGYTLVPILFGIFLIVMGMAGFSFIEDVK